MPIRAYLYDADGSDQEVELTSEQVRSLNDRQLLWVDALDSEEEEIQNLSHLFDIPDDAIQRLTQKSYRPELTNYGGFFTVSLKILKTEAKRLTTTHLHLLVGTNYLLTVHSDPIGFLEKFDATIQGDTPFGQLYAPAFLAVLLGWHLNDFHRVLERLEVEVDKLDDQALGAAENRELLSEMVTLRRRVGRIRRILTPHREVYSALIRPDYLLFSDNEVASHFKTLHDRLEKAIDSVENVRELVVSSFEIYATLTAQRTNDIVKLLTVATVAVMPISALAGILGMNFKSRVFDTGEMGLAVSLVVMLGVTALTLGVARWRRWI